MPRIDRAISARKNHEAGRGVPATGVRSIRRLVSVPATAIATQATAAIA